MPLVAVVFQRLAVQTSQEKGAFMGKSTYKYVLQFLYLQVKFKFYQYDLLLM
jgi:hypothetical protein